MYVNIDEFLGRKESIFNVDLIKNAAILNEIIENSSFLVIGGAGSIGQAVVKEIFSRNPRKLHIVDLSENNLTELLRDIRSSFGYISGEFKMYSLDVGSPVFSAFINSQDSYDYVINLSALKHVRSEKDPYTLMRMIDVNIINTISTIQSSIDKKSKKYFSVSTDKAANPINMMGASKKIMEMFLISKSEEIQISSTRFANVAFSDGSLLDSFINRFAKKQPLVAPNDIKRYFITPKESGELSLLSCLLAKNRELFFPKISNDLPEISFMDLAYSFIEKSGYKVYECQSEEEARSEAIKLIKNGFWPCFFSSSDTTGEKDLEEFYTQQEEVDFDRFNSIGVVNQKENLSSFILKDFLSNLNQIKEKGTWSKNDLVDLFKNVLKDFEYQDKGKYLDAKM